MLAILYFDIIVYRIKSGQVHFEKIIRNNNEVPLFNKNLLLFSF